jgi:uncharacterized membrane protein YkvI
MIMRMRQPNRRRFKSPIRERLKRQREYYYASLSVLVVKIILLIFLVILFSVSVRLFHYRFPHLTPALRYAVPTIVAIFAIVLIYFIYKNIKDLRDLHGERHKL